MKPKTTKAEFPDHAWEIILIAAAGMVLEGAVSLDWLQRETKLIEVDRKES